MLLLGACINISVPWKSLHATWVEYAQYAGDEENQTNDTDDESRDSKDEREERDDREEKEAEEYDKDFFGGQATFQFLSIGFCNWELTAASKLIPPHLDTFVPPPKANC
ncbi:MAG: hypothetical protein RLZZ519_645 [Bacteroidota bacterium]